MLRAVSNKFLPLFFSCHQKPERSFFYKGKQFPICARCTGILTGYFIGIALSILLNDFKWFFVPLLATPLIIDGTLQQYTKYESNNFKRFVTGIMFGIASIRIIIYIHLGTVRLAVLFLRAIT